jgi:hypothetical protein
MLKEKEVVAAVEMIVTLWKSHLSDRLGQRDVTLHTEVVGRSNSKQEKVRQISLITMSNLENILVHFFEEVSTKRYRCNCRCYDHQYLVR